MGYTPDDAIWAPEGTTAEHLPARVIASGDFVLVHQAHGFWGLSHAECTQRFSVWAEVIRRDRRIFTVRIGNVAAEVGVRNLDVLVPRQTGV